MSLAARLSLFLTRRMSSQVPAIPRPSASLVIINERNEVLLVHRNPKASTFAGAHVFPGGNFDKRQDSSLGMTAIRETFEESGLLLASPLSAIPDTSALESARHEIHSQKRTFVDFLAQYGLVIDENSLLPFTEWITPIDAPRRFHARFYVTFLPSSSARGFSSGHKKEQIPTPDGGQEVISTRFLSPKAWISEFREGKITFMPPQYYILHTLVSLSSRDQVKDLSTGSFGKMVFNPKKLPGSMSEDGTAGILTYEGDETRGGAKGRLHRAHCSFAKGGITTKIDLQRNFDIFTEIEPQMLSKL